MSGLGGLFEGLAKGGGLDPEKLVRGGAQVTDEELARGWVELLVVGVTREKIEGGPSTEPMEVWHALAKGQRGLVARTIRGRAALARDLRFYAGDCGLVFGELRTGDVVPAPAGQGAWALLERESSGAAGLVLRVRINAKAGRMAGQGRGFAYETACCGIALAQARAAFPELSQVVVAGTILALPCEEGESPREVAAELLDSEAEREHEHEKRREKRRGRA